MVDTILSNVGVAGGIADMTPASFISRTVEDSAGIAYGLPVKQGTNDGGCTAGIAAGAFTGVTVAQADKSSFAQYDSARVMVEGAVWLTAGGTIAAGNKVMVNAAGVWKANAVGATTNFTLTEAEAETSAASGELFKLRIWGTNVTAQTVS